MSADFATVQWDAQLERDCRDLVRLALREDLCWQEDWTTTAIVDVDRQGAADVVARQAGVVAGLKSVAIVLAEGRAHATFKPSLADGDVVEPGATLGRIEGAARDLLTCERTILNLLSRLCGVATLTSRYVEAVAGTNAAVYDTRKTTPGWRRLEKYAVRCGGGHNHRTGLFDAVLIKDNHLALAGEADLTPADAVRKVREVAAEMLIEIEVDTLEQFANVLPAGPDIVLLDNMSNDHLREAVALRKEEAPDVVLEASGGVRLDTIGKIAQTGVDRISVGALTHSAIGLDIGLDWVV